MRTLAAGPHLLAESRRMTSQTRTLDAGPPSLTDSTRMPLTPSCAVEESGANAMPSTGRTTRPLAMISATESFTVSTGIANPTPLFAPLGLYMAVLMPIRSPAHALPAESDQVRSNSCKCAWQQLQQHSAPEESSRGPPLFPGLIAASVCTQAARQWLGCNHKSVSGWGAIARACRPTLLPRGACFSMLEQY
jgi:hypothetical protein